MDVSTERIFRRTCEECERPALTLDDRDRALCPDHASVFIADTRTDPSDEERW